MQSAPDLTPILADLWVKAQNIPDGEKAAKRLAAMLPPQIQQMESDEGEDIPPAALQQISMKDAQIAELSHALETAHAEHTQLEQETKAGNQVETMKAQNQAAIKQAELANDKAKSYMAENIRLQIAREQMASNERIAKLNAELELIKMQADAQQAQAAREDEKILEGQRLSVDVQKHQDSMAASERANQQKSDLEREKMETAAKEKAEPKQEPIDMEKHLKPIHQAIADLKTASTKPKKTSVKLSKVNGEWVGEKIEQ
jgi:hypothetical protein